MLTTRIHAVMERIALITCLFSAQLFEDPNGLFTKISERLRISNRSSKFPQVASPNPEAERLVALGQLSSGACLFMHSGIRGKWRAKQVQRQLEELDTPIAQSMPLGGNHTASKVLFYFTNSLPYTRSGYTERSHTILKALREEGIRVQGVTRPGYPVLIGNLLSPARSLVDGISYFRILPPTFPSDWAKRLEMSVEMLVRASEEFGAEILHTTTDYKNAIVVSLAAQRLGIPWVYEARGELHKTWLAKVDLNDRRAAAESEFYLRAAEKELEAMQKSAAVLTLSDVAKQQFFDCEVPEEKMISVPNAISSSDIRRNIEKEVLRKELKLPDGFLIGTVTSVVGYEGLDDLIKCVALLENTYCLVVGDGVAKPELEKLVIKLNIQDRVIFAGKQESSTIWKWYGVLDAFVVPRKDEVVCRTVTPIKTLKAQALGVPVIASDLPALREVTGNQALYVKPESPVELAKAVVKLQSLPESNLNEMREMGIAWVSTRTWETNAKNLVELYQQASGN